jgi:hypothetical protein
METITILLRKIKALAERGATEGERNAAAQRLDALMRKHNITPEQLVDEQLDWVEFLFPPGASDLFVQIVCDVTNQRGLKIRQRPKQKTRMEVCVSKTQRADIAAMCAHYFAIFRKERKELAKQLKKLGLAIAFRFDIGSNVPSDPNAKPAKQMTPDEIAELLRMMRSISGKAYIRPASQLADKP